MSRPGARWLDRSRTSSMLEPPSVGQVVTRQSYSAPAPVAWVWSRSVRVSRSESVVSGNSWLMHAWRNSVAACNICQVQSSPGYGTKVNMTRPRAARDSATNDVDAVTEAVLTASRLLMAVSARSTAAVDDAIPIPQFRLLVVLDSSGPLKLTAIADSLDVNPSTATRMVDRLITTNLISREPNPTSRRELVVALTTAGRNLVREVMRRRRAQINRIV